MLSIFHKKIVGPNLELFHYFIISLFHSRLQAPHVVDHGPENIHSPDGALYMVGTGCLADRPNPNCSWISGDAVYLTRTIQVKVMSFPNQLGTRTVAHVF